MIAEHRNGYDLESEHGLIGAELSGKLRHELERPEWPAVGDWVAIEPRLSERRATVRAVLPRRTCFARKVAGAATTKQVVAANVDVAFVVTAFGADFSVRRIERYLTLAWESGASPVLVLTKSDLVDDASERTDETRDVALGTPVVVANGLTGLGVDALRAHLGKGRTGVFVGSSGVGKSTLANALLQANVQLTIPIRESDGTGQHTTTRRELFRVPGGGLLIDAPGMREITLIGSDGGVDEAFADLVALGSECRFRDCAHEVEPGCAVRSAVEEGRFDAARLKSFRKQKAELARLEAKATRSRGAPRRTRA